MNLGYCQYCKSGRRLPSIGLNRKNGRTTHEDWPSRKYHKKCWLILQNEEERRLLNYLWFKTDI